MVIFHTCVNVYQRVYLCCLVSGKATRGVSSESSMAFLHAGEIVKKWCLFGDLGSNFPNTSNRCGILSSKLQTVDHHIFLMDRWSIKGILAMWVDHGVKTSEISLAQEIEDQSAGILGPRDGLAIHSWTPSLLDWESCWFAAGNPRS